jgi:cold shock CspA family protein
LQLTRELVSSPHINVVDLLKAIYDRTTIDVSIEDIKLAMVRGKYDIYPSGTNAFVQNIFDLIPDSETTPLLSVRVLEFLRGAWTSNPDNDGRYVGVRAIQDYFHQVGIEPRTSTKCLNALLRTGLVLEYDPTAKEVTNDGRVQISPSGRQHLLWALGDFVYLESMAITTPLLEESVFDEIKALCGVDRSDCRRKLIVSFVNYLLSEDRHFITVPKHEAFEGQLSVTDMLQRFAVKASSVPSAADIGRFARHIGRVSRWDQDRGFGIIELTSPYKTALLHFRDILSPNSGYLLSDALVECDLDDSSQRLRAFNAVQIESS